VELALFLADLVKQFVLIGALLEVLVVLLLFHVFLEVFAVLMPVWLFLVEFVMTFCLRCSSWSSHCASPFS